MLTYSQIRRYCLPPCFVLFPSLHANFVAQDRDRSKGRDHRVYSVARNPVGVWAIRFSTVATNGGQAHDSDGKCVGGGEIERKGENGRAKKSERERERTHTKRMRESPDCTVNVGHFESQASRFPVRKVSFHPRVL